eukprot:TRINITY_DN7911_c0_g3_i3.p1 TRINITY_DN7911_c0_g3~~TRINITY_DN7911_c0_g3_i3.p1  ORF type:complete len:1288 (+),score=383.46 TRINITY_DN7911_c0_g3_i3:110-3973(+)
MRMLCVFFTLAVAVAAQFRPPFVPGRPYPSAIPLGAPPYGFAGPFQLCAMLRSEPECYSAIPCAWSSVDSTCQVRVPVLACTTSRACTDVSCTSFFCQDMRCELVTDVCVPRARPPPPPGGVVAVTLAVGGVDQTTLPTVKQTLKQIVIDTLTAVGLPGIEPCIINPLQEHPEGFGTVGLTMLMSTTNANPNGDCSLLAPMAKVMWDEAQMEQHMHAWIVSFLALYNITAVSASTPVVNELLVEQAIQEVLNSLRQQGDIDEVAQEAAVFQNAIQASVSNTFTNPTDSAWCTATVQALHCSDSLSKATSMQAVQGCDECSSRIRAFLDSDPKSIIRVAEECSPETTSSLIYFSSVTCLRHEGELCMEPVSTIFYPFFKAHETSSPDPAAVATLTQHCGPCLSKIAQGFRTHDATLGFLGNTRWNQAAPIQTNFSRFLEYVCGTSSYAAGGPDPLCADTQLLLDQSVLTADQLCRPGGECEFRSAVATASSPGHVDRMSLLCTVSDKRVNGNPQLCGDIYDARHAVVDALGMEGSCNLGVLAYRKDVATCDTVLANITKGATTVCQSLEELSCCASELLYAYIRRNLFTEAEMKAGLQLLCPTLTLQRCFASGVQDNNWQLVMKATSPDFVRLNGQHLLESLRSDLSLSLGVPASSLGAGQLKVVGPDTVVAQFPNLGNAPASGTGLRLALHSSKGLYQRGVYGDLTLLASSSGMLDSGVQAECTSLMGRIDAQCGSGFINDLMANGSSAENGWPGPGFCQSGCYTEAVATVDDIIRSCPAAVAAPVVFVAEMACVTSGADNCFASMLSQGGKVNAAVKSLRLASSAQASLRQGICQNPCTAKMLAAQRRYEARLLNLGIRVSLDDETAAYRAAFLKAACTVHTTDASDESCFTASFEYLLSPHGLSQRAADTSHCGLAGSDPAKGACISRTMRLATEELLRNPAAPFNASGIFKSRCVRVEQGFCGTRFAQVSIPTHCEPVKLKGTVPADCVAPLKQRLAALGCCETHLLEGAIESLSGTERSEARDAHSATLRTLGVTSAGLCNATVVPTRTVQMRVNADFSWCEKDIEGCTHALVADLVQNMGLNSGGEVVNVTLSSGSTIVSAQVATGDGAYDEAVGNTLLANQESVTLGNTNQWARTHTTRPVELLDLQVSGLPAVPPGPGPDGPEPPVTPGNPTGTPTSPNQPEPEAPSDSALSALLKWGLPALGLCILSGTLVMALRRRQKGANTHAQALILPDESQNVKSEHVDMTEIASAVSDSSTPYHRDVSDFIEPGSPYKDREMSI